MLMDQAMLMMEKFVNEIREAEPEKRDHFVKLSSSMFEISQELFKVSPEFRRGFAEVHSDFLKYPESEALVKACAEAYNKYLENNS